MKRYEKSGRRTGSTRAGALDDTAGIVAAARPAGTEHERQFAALSTGAGSQRRFAPEHREACASSSTLWRRNDLPEAAPGWSVRQPQASGSPVRAGEAADQASAAQEGPVADRHPLIRPEAANEVWSMDFVFDRVAGERAIKYLAIVDDATHEAVAVVPAHSISGQQVVRILERLDSSRGLPKIIRTDNGKEFCGKAMLTWAHEKSLGLRLIEPGRPNQNAYIESFNGRFRDECLNEHWFTSLAHAQVVIEAWRREYNEERPKKALGGLTPAAYAKQLAAKTVTVTLDSNSNRY